MAYDRAETNSLLEDFVGKEYSLIVVQLGENVTNTDSLKEDFADLIHHLKK